MNNIRSKVLIISHNPTHTSGVGGQCRHICKKLYQNNFDPTVVSYSLQPPIPPFKHKFDTGEEVTIFSSQLQHEQFADLDLVFSLIIKEKFSCCILFDDPRRFAALLDHATFIRARMPLYFVHLWDSWLAPDDKSTLPHYNLVLYENFDSIGCISKQTEWFVNKVYEKVKYSTKPALSYVGHGDDPKIFKPLAKDETTELYAKCFINAQYDFIALMVNQNQYRKKMIDMIEGWKLFYDSLPPEQAVKCALLLRTTPLEPSGTDLKQCIEALAPNRNVWVLIYNISDDDLNKVFNLSDVVVNCSNAEGFGLTVNDGMLAGKPTICNVVGGLTDQCGFVDDQGKLITWNPENYKNLNTAKHGEWCYPLFGQRTIIGSPVTPYGYDYNASIDDIAEGFKYWHDIPKDERAKRGLAGREYCLNHGLYNEAFANAVVRDVTQAIADFKPKSSFQLYEC